MRITFQNTDTNQGIEQQKTQQRESSAHKVDKDRGYGYLLDISGSSSDHEICRQEKKTVEDVMMEASCQNVDLTRDYMAVMSNSMSDEDFAKLQENGYQTGSTNVETAVTIVDEIKASLLEAGVSISGYTDTLDMDTLTEIIGDTGLARELAEAFSEKGVPLTEETAEKAMEALKEAESLRTPGEDTVKYMVFHEKEPVIQDLYTAQYSSTENHSRQSRGYYEDGNGYLAKRADQINWDSLQPQIERIVEEAGLADVEGAVEGARRLIGAGIPLTESTLSSYMELQKISFPMERKELLSAMAVAVSDGKSAMEADLTGKGSLWDRARMIWNKVQSLTDEAADAVAAEGKDLTIHNLEAARRLMESGYQNVTQENAAARRQLEEVRLQMTILANRELLKSGFAIETAPLEQVIEALRDVEQGYRAVLFGGATVEETFSRFELYKETIRTAGDIPRMPLAAVGRVAISETEFGLRQVKESGEALAASYRKANESYETFQTAPRSDMGDSIAKAFRNTETLLDELGLEATDANKRAVRILGYNRLEITEENIMTVKEADEVLRNVIKKLTPAAALEMIRDGKNPLTMTVAQLDDYLNERDRDPEREQEKFSKYLYKLERKKEITPEEKKSYIGIFRLLRQVEKSDGAVIGSLLHQGASLSFKNLLTFVRTARTGKIDAAVDDSLGALQEVREKGEAIDRQIESAFTVTESDGRDDNEIRYYVGLGHEAYDGLDGDKVVQIAPEESMELEAFTQRLRETEEEDELNRWYLKEQTAFCRQTCPDKGTLSMLHMLEEPVTMEHVQAMNAYRKGSGKGFARIDEEARRQAEEGENRFLKSLSDLEEKFTDRESASAAYGHLAETEKEILEEAMYESDDITFSDMRELGLLYKQVSFTAKLSDMEKYDIPVITDDSVLALHVQIVHSQEDRGTAEASMDTDLYGKISVKLQMEGNSVRGFFIGSSEKGREKLTAIKERAQESLSRAGFQTESMETGIRADLRTGFTPEESREEREAKPASARTLYRAVKEVIMTIRKEMERG